MPNGDKVRKRTLMVQWYKDCITAAEKNDREQMVQNASTVLVLLKNILVEDKARLTSPKIADYDTPAWQYKLAHVNGQLEQIDNLLKLLDPFEE